MCHIIHMLQSQQLILHEQQQTLKKKLSSAQMKAVIMPSF